MPREPPEDCSLSEAQLRRANKPPAGIDRAIAQAAAARGDILSLGELKALGLSARGVQQRASRGELHRHARGIYTPGSPLLTKPGRWRAALLAAGDGAALSHRSAADLATVMRWNGPVEVTSPAQRRERLDGIAIYGRRVLDPRDVVMRHGVRVTSIPRTFVDLAAVLPDRELEALFDDAQARGLVSLRTLDGALRRAGGRKGTGALRRLAADATGGVTRSRLERAFRVVLRRGWLPPYRRNVRMQVGGPTIEADVVWPEQRVIVELDGRDVHTRRRAFYADRERDFALAVERWVVVRLTWRHCTTDAALTFERLTALLVSPSSVR